MRSKSFKCSRAKCVDPIVVRRWAWPIASFTFTTSRPSASHTVTRRWRHLLRFRVASEGLGPNPMGKKPSKPKVRLTRAELEALLEEVLEEIEHEANRFDVGRDAAAKHLAVLIRVLVHDTSKSHSLLGQLGRKAELFVDTVQARDPKDVSATHHGLASMAFPLPGVRLRRDYVAMLDRNVNTAAPRVAFADWWNAVVFASKDMGELTRRDLILAVANEDGGAHVDPEGLSEPYAKLAKLNALGWTRRETGKAARPLSGPHLVAIRQIAHEVLKTFRPGYGKRPIIEAGTALAMGAVSVVPQTGKQQPVTSGAAEQPATVTVHQVKGRGYVVLLGRRRIQIPDSSIDAELSRRQAVGGGIAAGNPTNLRIGVAVDLAKRTVR